MDDVERYLSSCALNLPAYLAEEDRLEREHRGEYALLRDSELVGVCETIEEADAMGAEVAENGDYVVFLIGKQRLRYSDAGMTPARISAQDHPGGPPLPPSGPPAQGGRSVGGARLELRLRGRIHSNLSG